MAKAKILLMLDGDPQPSVFDAVVAVDSGVEHLFRHGNVQPAQVKDLVYGGMFTRGPADLAHTAVFIGGSHVDQAEELLAAAKRTFFGPFQLPVMIDPNGSNTTAAAAVLAVAKHVPLGGARCLVLGATGAVGQRVVRMLAKEGATTLVASRALNKAQDVCEWISERAAGAQLTPLAWDPAAGNQAALEGVQVVVAAGAPSVTLLPLVAWQGKGTRVAVDLNAVPPLGITGIEAQDAAVTRHDVICYGALGVGGSKMKIHKAAIAQLFTDNRQVLDAEEIFDLGKALLAK